MSCPNQTPFADLQARAADLAVMGVRHIWLISPEMKAAWMFDNGSWLKCTEPRLSIQDSPIHLDLEWLWRKLDR